MVNIFIVITITIIFIIMIITTIIHLIQWPTMAQSPFPPCFDFGLFCPRLPILDWIGSYHNIAIHLITIITPLQVDCYAQLSHCGCNLVSQRGVYPVTDSCGGGWGLF